VNVGVRLRWTAEGVEVLEFVPDAPASLDDEVLGVVIAEGFADRLEPADVRRTEPGLVRLLTSVGVALELDDVSGKLVGIGLRTAPGLAGVDTEDCRGRAWLPFIGLVI